MLGNLIKTMKPEFNEKYSIKESSARIDMILDNKEKCHSHGLAYLCMDIAYELSRRAEREYPWVKSKKITLENVEKDTHEENVNEYLAFCQRKGTDFTESDSTITLPKQRRK